MPLLERLNSTNEPPNSSSLPDDQQTPMPHADCQLLDGKPCEAIGTCYIQASMRDQARKGGVQEGFKLPGGDHFTELQWELVGYYARGSAVISGCGDQEGVIAVFEELKKHKKKTHKLHSVTGSLYPVPKALEDTYTPAPETLLLPALTLTRP